MARPQLPAATSLGPNLGPDQRRVYGGRVIAESEEEYATRRQPALLSQGYVEPYRAPGGSTAGVEYSRFGVLPGNGACMRPRGEPQMVDGPGLKVLPQRGLGGPRDKGRPLMAYPGVEMERFKSGGLLRSIREGAMLMHAAGPAQLPQQASMLHRQQQQQQLEDRYLQPHGVWSAMDYRLHHQYNSYSGRYVYPGHSMPIRDHRTVYNHITPGGENMCNVHEGLRREPQKRNLDGTGGPIGGGQVYSAVQDVRRIGVEDLMPLSRHQVQNYGGSGNVQPLALASSRNGAVVQGKRMHSLLPPGTMQMAPHGSPRVNQPIRPVGSFTALLHDAHHEPAKVETVRSQETTRNGFPREPNAADIDVNLDLSGSQDQPGRSMVLPVAKIPSMSSSNTMHGLQPIASPPSLPQYVRPTIGCHSNMMRQNPQGLPHAHQLDIGHLNNKPKLQTVPPAGVVRKERSFTDIESRWPSEEELDIDKSKEKPLDLTRGSADNQRILPVKSPLEGIMQQREASNELLSVENGLVENDAMLRPFGDTVGMEDLFDEGFELDGGSFAHISQTNLKDYLHTPDDPQVLNCSVNLHSVTHSTMSNPSEQVEVTQHQLTGADGFDGLKEKLDGISPMDGYSERHEELLESCEDDGSPATSLDFMDISTAQLPSIDSDSIWEKNKPYCHQLESFSPDHIPNKDERDNCCDPGLFEEGETTEDKELDPDTIKGNVGLKCPRIFHELSSNEKPESALSCKVPQATSRGQHPLTKCMRPTKKLQIPSVEKKIPYQMCDFLAVTGLGFDDNEHQNFPKAPPRFPRKMTVKREDVVQLAISTARKAAVTVEEILDVCNWWKVQSEAEAGAASRANVLKNWYGLKLAAAFTEGVEGRASLVKCLEQDDRFGVCGFTDDGQELWSCQQLERCGDNLDERRSDSDDKTNYWTPEQEEWIWKSEESPSTKLRHKESVYQKAVLDERKRRRLLTTLQSELVPKLGLGFERVFESSEAQPSPFWNHVDDTQSLNHDPDCKRLASSCMIGMRSDNKDCFKAQSYGKTKTRSLSDVYAHGPRVFNGNESSGTIPDQEMDSNPSSERPISEHNGRITYLDREKPSKQGFRSVGTG